MKTKNILILGAGGQLAKCFIDKLENTSFVTYTALSRNDLSITDSININKCLANNKFDFLINCAAYTDVAGAEHNEESALLANGYGPKVLAECCAKHNVKLIHFSTDYVYDGSSELKTEESLTNPLNLYGKTKLLGENEIINIAKNTNLEYMIIRTSWLYSEYGKNFVKTIISKALNGDDLFVVEDQVGSPTYAGDLAEFVIHDVVLNSDDKFISGIYNYSDRGVISWYDFASAAIELYVRNYYTALGHYPNVKFTLSPIITNVKEQKVNRPMVGILSKEKVIRDYNANIPYWRYSLENVVRKLITVE